MIKVAAYCRVSTDQDDQANSFASQQRYFREYIAANSQWELFEIYADEGITGTSTKKRAQFNRMIRDASLGKFNLILTKEVSRFSRNILDTISYTRQLKALGVGVLFVTDGIHTLKPDAELYLAIMASLAQEESRKTSSRVVWGQTRQMERGVVFGTSLLGYDVNQGNITVNPVGARTVRLIFQKYAVEQMGTSQIAAFLTREGYLTYRGNTRWTAAGVLRILRNEKYVGDLVQKKTYTPDYLTHGKRKNKGEVPLIRIKDHHEPIVSRALWQLTQERLQRNNKHNEGTWGHSNRYVFSGKIKCGECGAGFVGRFQYRKDGTKIRRWSCATAVGSGAAACNVGKLVRDDDAVQMLKSAVKSLPLDTEWVIQNVTALALDAIRAGEEGMEKDPARLRSEIDRVQQKKEALMDSYFSRDITKEDMKVMKQRYDQQLTDLQQRVTTMEGKTGTDADSLKTLMENELVSILEGETESEVFQKTILHSLTVFKDRHMELRLSHLPWVFWFLG